MMDNNLFDKKIAEIVNQHEEELPSLKNKESVWNTIESKMHKKHESKTIYYWVISAVACVALLVGVAFWLQQEEMNLTPIAQIQQQSPVIFKKDTILQKPQIELKENVVKKKASPTKNIAAKEKKSISIAENVAVDTLPKKIQEEDNLAVVQENTLQESKPSVVQDNKIKIRVSLSPRKKKDEEPEKIKFYFMNSFLAKNESTKENTREGRRSALIQIPLK